MKQGFRQSMAWLHTWAGLVTGWLLMAIFLTGTASYFREEISLWMRPELTRPVPVSADLAADAAIRWLQDKAAGAPTWLIDLPDARNPYLRASWRDGETGRFSHVILDPRTGTAPISRATLGGDVFYFFHFDLLMPGHWGRLVVGAAAMVMLVAIVSGVITHRRIFRDFFTFRPGRWQRSWLDAHNLFGVLALPYHLMITYTGLVTLMFLYMPWGADAAYRGEQEVFKARLYTLSPAGTRSGHAAALTPIAPLLTEASALWQGGNPGRITVNHPGDASATVQVLRRDSDRMSVNRQAVLFDGVTGRRLSDTGAGAPAAETHGVLYGLHLARFAEPFLRSLFFLSGLAGTVMVAAGLVLWTVKRRQKSVQRGRPSFGHRLVETLNIGAIAGMPIAIAAFFWANRLLPLDLPGRSGWEVYGFLGSWGVTFLHPIFRPLRKAWQEQLWVAAFAFGAIPMLNALTTDHGLAASVVTGDWVFAGFDLVMSGIGIVLGCIAWHVGRRHSAAGRPDEEDGGRRLRGAVHKERAIS